MALCFKAFRKIGIMKAGTYSSDGNIPKIKGGELLLVNFRIHFQIFSQKNDQRLP